MPAITYIEFDGTEYHVDVAVGNSVMEGALNNMIDGIVAECGGSCVCCTCHCMIDPEWSEVVGEANDEENRIAEAKSILLRHDAISQSILDVSFAVGFNSNSAFYAAFKKATGQTPAQFRRSVQSFA